MLSRRALLGSAAAGLYAQTSAKPEVLIVLAGQWRAQALPPENREVKLPHLERLMSEGITFTRAYSADPSPDAARVALLSGRFPHSGSPPPTAPETSLRLVTLNAALPPRTAVERFAYLFPPSSLPLRSNVPAELDARVKSEYATYYSLLSAADEELGKLLDDLERTGRARNTIVVFTSGNGDMLGSHGLEGRDESYEESVRVPLVIRYPAALKGGRTEPALVSHIDLLPTLLSLSEAAVPNGLQGRDLSTLLVSGTGSRPESIYAEGRLASPGEWRMLVRGLDKIVVNRRQEVTRLFNLGQDPFEMENVASDPALELRRNGLLALLKIWMRRLEDSMDSSGLKRRN